MRRFTPILVVVLLVVAPVSGATPSDLDTTGDDGIAPAAIDRPDQTATYDGPSGLQPGWIVTHDATDRAQLLDWVDAADARRHVANITSNKTLVTAPASHVLPEIVVKSLKTTINLPTGAELSTRSYVQTVTPELRHELAEPVVLKSNRTYERPTGARAAQARSLGKATFDRTGMAWDEDADRSSMLEARTATGSTAVPETGNGVLVAVIDTGANTADGRVFGNSSAGSDIRIHNASKSYVEAGEPSVNATAENYTAIEDGNGHGTWVASAIAANTTDDERDGYAPDADLLVLRALNDDGEGSTADIARAVRYAADEGADVISMSLGSPVYDQELADAVRYAEQQGSIVVVAAGNSRQTVKWVASPSDTPGNVTTVGAANVSDNASRTLPAYFSQVGPDPGSTDLSTGVTQGQGVDVVAPGMDVVAAVPTTSGSVKNRSLSGTSMATPMVAGGLAQLIESNASLSDPKAAHEHLRATARPMPNASEAAVGAGYLAVDKAANSDATGDQHEAMTDEAEARDAGLRALSKTSGGLAFSAWERISEVIA